MEFIVEFIVDFIGEILSWLLDVTIRKLSKKWRHKS